jgi:hypothetical protein
MRIPAQLNLQAGGRRAGEVGSHAGLYATNRPHLLWQRLDDHQRRAGLALNLYPGLVYLLAFLVARIAPGLSLLIYAGLPVLYFLSITVLRSGRKRNQEYADFT